MALILAVALTVYFFLYRFYRGTCVDLQRLYATTQSPIQAHFMETLDGMESVRAFGVQVRKTS